MKFFAIYMKTDANAPLETVKCVSSRFSFIAGIFQGFWALYHRVWWLAGLLITIEVLLGYGRTTHWLSDTSAIVINLGMFAFVGFSASDWLEAHFKQKGYTLMNVVIASNEMDAKARFLQQYMARKPSGSSLPSKEAFA